MNHKTVSHSKCKKCGAVKNVAELLEWPEGFGKVCIDEVVCRATEEVSKRARANESKNPELHRDQSPKGDA